jgi:hypothetical protein
MLGLVSRFVFPVHILHEVCFLEQYMAAGIESKPGNRIIDGIVLPSAGLNINFGPARPFAIDNYTRSPFDKNHPRTAVLAGINPTPNAKRQIY